MIAPTPPHRAGAGTHSGEGAWLAAAGLTVLSWVIQAWPWLSGRVTIPWDAKAHFQPQIAFLAQSLARGDSPFWAPFVFGGHPQIADPQSLIFSPSALLLALITPSPGLNALDGVMLATLLLGGLAMLGHARDRGWHPAAGALTAIVFCFGASAAWRNQHVGQVFSLAYFPITLFLLERALQRASRSYGALAGLAAGLMILGPDQVAFLGALLLALYVIGFWLDGARADRARRFLSSLLPLSLGALVGLSVIAVPLGLTLALAEMSNRAMISLKEAGYGSLHPTSLLTFFFANLFGTDGPADEYWGAPSLHWPYIVKLYLARNMSDIYMGAAAMLAIAYAAFSGVAAARGNRILAILFLVSVLYALGRYTPFFGALFHVLPGVDLFRRPADATFLIGASGALLAGAGLDAFLKTADDDRRALLLCGGTVLAGFALAVAVAIHVGRLPNAVRPLLESAGFIALTVGGLMLARRMLPGKAPWVAALLVAIVTFDLAVNNGPNESTGLAPAEYDVLRADTRNETIAFLKQRLAATQAPDRLDRVELAGLGFHWPNAGLVHRLPSTLGYNPVRLKHFADATGALDQVAGHDQRQFSKLYPSYRSPMANLLGLRFIAVGVPLEIIDSRLWTDPLPLIGETNDAYIYENPEALPRVMVVPTAVGADQDRLIATGTWPVEDFRRTVVLSPEDLAPENLAPENLAPRELGPRDVAPSASPSAENGSGTARLLSYRNTKIVVAATAPQGGYLVLNDIWHPWWEAELNGRTVPLLRANAIFRAIALPPGEHRVRFVFRPFKGLARDLLNAIRRRMAA